MEHRRQAGRVANGTQRRHRSLATAGVAVPGRGGRQCGYRVAHPPLGEIPRRPNDNERVGIVQRGSEGTRERRTRARPAGIERHFDTTAPHGRRRVAESFDDVSGREVAHPGQGTQRCRVDTWVRIGETTAGDRGLAPVSRHGDAPAPDSGAAVAARIRGNIVAHLPSMSEPDASADGEAAAIPTSSDAGPRPAGAMAASDGTVPPVPPTAPRRRRRIWPIVFGSLVGLIIVVAIIAAHTSVNDYVITPGDATPVAQFIDVPAADNHPLTGKILLTDVFVTRLNALNYLQYRYFNSDSEVVSGGELLGPTVNEDQFLSQGYLQMAQAQSFATASALSHLGYTVTSTNAGALVYGVQPHSPAARTLHVGQVITGVNGHPTTTDCALIDALHGETPGTSVALSVQENTINDVGSVVRGPVVTKSVTLGAPPKGLVDTRCGKPTKPTAYLGIVPQTQQDWHFPVQVTVHTKDIGGPSAGLAMSLGIIDKLSSGRLTGNRIIAATGTIDQHGNVGDVGGVAEKTVAVERAGATVFFVPSRELKTAESKATPQLHVYAVSNLNQVLAILQRLGGHVPTTPVPPKPVPAQTAP